MRLPVRVLAIALFGALAACDDPSPPQPTRLMFVAEPSASLVATEPHPAIQVAFVTEDGTVAAAVSDTVRLVVTGTAELFGDLEVAAVNGVATFNAKVEAAGSAYQLVAHTARFEAPAFSSAFSIVPGPPSTLRIEPQDDTGWVGVVLPTLVRVTDAVGNTVTTAAHAVTLSTTGALQGTTTATAIAGVASFPDLALCSSGINGRISAMPAILRANAPGLAEGTVSVALFPGAETGLRWLTQPSNGAAGVKLPPYELMVHDCGGNPVYASLVLGWGGCTPELVNNPTGASIIPASGQGYPIAMTWAYTHNNNTAIDRAGTGYTMRVTCRKSGNPAIVVTSVPSNPFDVAP
jgi:hypothetical protein